MMFENSNASPSACRRASASSTASSSSDIGFGLDGLLPEPESPLPAPFSFATYEVPENGLAMTISGRTRLILRLVGSHPLWGHHLWNTSRILADYLVHHPELTLGRRICELGAGAGLPSIVATLEGAEKVVVTDYPDEGLIENLRWNGETNIPFDKKGRLDVQGYLWGHDPAPLLASSPAFDLVLLSDLVFNHSQHPALIKSVNALLAPSTPTTTPYVLIFITHHRPHLARADMAFLQSLANSGPGWAYKRVVQEYTGPMFETDPGEERVRGTVHGFKAWRVRDGEASGEMLAA